MSGLRPEAVGEVAPLGEPGVAQFLRLKLQLTANLFKRSPWQIAAIVLGLVYGFSITVFAVLALAGLRLAPVQVAAPFVVTAGSLTTLGFFVVPLLVGVDDTLDPHRFAAFGVNRSRLALALGAASLAGIPAVVVAIIALATTITWSRSPLAALVALVTVPVVVVTCVLTARISAAAAGLLLATRRSREALSAILILTLVVVSPVVVVLVNLRFAPGGAAAAGSLAAVLAWTPLGAMWAAPATIAAGSAAGLLQLVESVVVVAGLWFGWRALVGLTVVTPPRQGRARAFGGLGWFSRVPSTPLGAIAARSLTYWARDVRYRLGVAMVPITPVLVVVPLLVAGAPGRILALVPLPIVALFLGWLPHNDVAFDGSAIWLHVVSGIRGRDDLLGRAVPVLAVGLPVIVAGSIVSGVVAGRPAAVLGLLGVCLCLLGAGLGLGFVSSSRFPYPVAPPGVSPFQQPASSGATTAIVQSITFFGEFVLALPAVGLGIAGLLTGSSGWFVASLLVGVAIGALVFAGGLAAGGRLLQRRGPEVLAAALRA